MHPLLDLFSYLTRIKLTEAPHRSIISSRLSFGSLRAIFNFADPFSLNVQNSRQSSLLFYPKGAYSHKNRNKKRGVKRTRTKSTEKSIEIYQIATTMADHTDRPAEPISEVEPTDFKPMSNVEEFSLPMTADDIARMDPRLGAAMASGLPLEDVDDDDEEDMDEGYVAVDHDDTSDFSYWFRRPPVHQRTQLDELHPFVQVLSVSNVDDCVQVENSLPEPERCSREKVC